MAIWPNSYGTEGGIVTTRAEAYLTGAAIKRLYHEAQAYIEEWTGSSLLDDAKEFTESIIYDDEPMDGFLACRITFARLDSNRTIVIEDVMFTTVGEFVRGAIQFF
jgi:hypothetical protein